MYEHIYICNIEDDDDDDDVRDIAQTSTIVDHFPETNNDLILSAATYIYDIIHMDEENEEVNVDVHANELQGERCCMEAKNRYPC